MSSEAEKKDHFYQSGLLAAGTEWSLGFLFSERQNSAFPIGVQSHRAFCQDREGCISSPCVSLQCSIWGEGDHPGLTLKGRSQPRFLPQPLPPCV